MTALTPFSLTIRNLSKSYGNLTVWSGLNLTFHSDTVYCLMSPSGSGKTTLFRILLGLEQPDEGDITMTPKQKLRLTAVFQEDRLCEAFSPIDNILLTAGRFLSRSQAAQELCRLLPEESITRPVSTLSGGMKRRTAIIRAMLTPSCGILMDEPFTGLDDATKDHVIRYIREKTNGRLLIVATHQQEDAEALGGVLLHPFL